MLRYFYAIRFSIYLCDGECIECREESVRRFRRFLIKIYGRDSTECNGHTVHLDRCNGRLEGWFCSHSKIGDSGAVDLGALAVFDIRTCILGIRG